MQNCIPHEGLQMKAGVNVPNACTRKGKPAKAHSVSNTKHRRKQHRHTSLNSNRGTAGALLAAYAGWKSSDSKFIKKFKINSNGYKPFAEIQDYIDKL